MASGLLIVLYSFYLGIVESFNHFYEFTLLGLLFMLLPRTFRAFPASLILKLYAAFVAIALFGDLVIVLGFTHLWYYNYSSAWEYAVLYLFIYPAGGFVMLASYLIAQRYFTHTIIERSSRNYWPLLSIGALLFFVIVLIELIFAHAFGTFWSFVFTISIFVTTGLFVMAASEYVYKKSFIRDFISDPWCCFLAITTATYLNLLVHEYPNLYANEWVYVINTHSMLDTFFLGSPIAVWVSWPALTVASVSLYYFFGGRSEVAEKI